LLLISDFHCEAYFSAACFLQHENSSYYINLALHVMLHYMLGVLIGFLVACWLSTALSCSRHKSQSPWSHGKRRANRQRSKSHIDLRPPAQQAMPSRPHARQSSASQCPTKSH